MKIRAQRHEERDTICDVPDEDLSRYVAGDIGGARGEWIEAHLRVCLHCLRRHAVLAEADHRLRAYVARLPVPDDPARHAAMRARIAHAFADRATSPWWRFWGRVTRWRPRHPLPFLCLVVLKVALLAVLVMGTPATGGLFLGGALALVSIGLLVSGGKVGR